MATKNTSVELGTDIAGFVSTQVKSGRYGSASEVVRAGLRMLQNEETKMAALRTALIAGEKSGDANTFYMEEFITKKRSEC